MDDITIGVLLIELPTQQHQKQLSEKASSLVAASASATSTTSSTSSYQRPKRRTPSRSAKKKMRTNVILDETRPTVKEFTILTKARPVKRKK